MHKKTKYMNIEYSDKDIWYIDELINGLGNISQEIVDFFDIREINVNVILYNSIEKFRKKFWEIFCYQCKEWTCGFVSRKKENTIYTLSLDEYRKTKYHELHNLDDLIFLILHEFVHSCHNQYTKNHLYVWLSEGLATYLSQQYDKYHVNELNCQLDNLINGGVSYNNYYFMFKYTYEKYGIDYIKMLLKNEQFMIEQTPFLYNSIIKNKKMVK